MHNFKYHSVEELERLIEQLKNEIAGIEPYVGDDPLAPNWDGFRKRQLDECKDMLRHAEYEILERTLLK